ncbi:hypothetical protein Hdeb2414_s0001g00009631 [Helianthus debilis subsp. tardiflorus]
MYQEKLNGLAMISLVHEILEAKVGTHEVLQPNIKRKIGNQEFLQPVILPIG